VVRRLTPLIRDQRCDYDLSLGVLSYAKHKSPSGLVKSSIMLGIGERPDEVEQTLADLRKAGVDIVTLGQYLRPTAKHAAVERYVEPSEFQRLERVAYDLGFAFVASGPLVRSSYHAAEGFVQATLRPSAGTERAPYSDGNAPYLPETPAPANGPALIRPESLVRRTLEQR
jgi:lipoyl synthase